MLSLKNNYKTLSLALLSTLLFISCSKEETGNGEGKMAVSAKSTINDPASNKSSSTLKQSNSGLVITNFLINLVEFELEIDVEEPDMEGVEDEEWDDDGFFDSEDEIELEGPFALDLMAGQISFLNVTVPNGRYEEMEFKINKSTDSSSELFEKSVLIKGTINDIPFIYWNDFMDEIEVDFEDPTMDVTINDATTNLLIDFNLSALFFDAAGIDLSQAQDGNNDGTIEISPSDEDGNNELAQAIRNKMREVIDLLDD
ncbi:hypothetical protein PP178_01940 [Zeaxanthinibacter sp. PT1]|uniref:hypothetical protein n=1 Tax=Zeaxanthinibacter TaxID=561554 RepID=UPI002349C164|nr:hypothetical protein [Zeaxanthinibacter sp. PT1]MDC6350297.1 hypothetical protein [Zeaxanthinibacter sp. PT1]